MLVSFASIYNPLHLLLAVPRFDKVRFDKVRAERIAFQLLGMSGVAKSIYQSRDWPAWLITGPIEKLAEFLGPRFPMVALNGVSHEPARGA